MKEHIEVPFEEVVSEVLDTLLSQDQDSVEECLLEQKREFFKARDALGQRVHDGYKALLSEIENDEK